MHDLRSDSEEDLDNSLSTTSLSPSKPERRYEAHSSDDEYDRIRNRLSARGNNEKQPQSNRDSREPERERESNAVNVRTNVRKAPTTRPNNVPDPTRVGGGNRGFVPKELNNRNSQNRRDNGQRNEDMTENANWGKVPKRFLDQDSSPSSNQKPIFAAAKPYEPAPDRDDRRQQAPPARGDSWNRRPLPSAQEPAPRSYHASNNDDEPDDAAEDEEDGRSVGSFADVNDFNAPTPPAKERVSKYSQLLEAQNQKKRQAGGREEAKTREQEELSRKSAVSTNSPSRKFNNGGANSVNSSMENNAIEGSFAKYVERSEAQGGQLPRKSGRYDEDEEQEGDDLAEQYSKDNWLMPSSSSKAIATSSFKSSSVSARSTYSTTKSFSFVLVAHPRGLRSEHVQCTVRRDRSSMQGKLYPTYELILEEPRKTLIVARKMNLNRTSNYHLFDMTRGAAGSKFSKKNGNYLGKLRAKNANRTEYVLLNQSSEREEVAGVLFERMTLLGQMSTGVQPRKMKILVPHVDEYGVPIAHKNQENVKESSLSEKLIILDDCEQSGATAPSHVEMEKFEIFQSKDPVYENGNYRLNFNGRVSMPSVKNYQLVSPNDISNIICQFGKVDEDEFHLDYKAPFNAFQAFSFALCQFNL